MLQQTSEYYLAVYRNGSEIPQTEYALLTHATIKADYFDKNTKTSVLTFGITNSSTNNNQQKDYFDVMRQYIFSRNDSFKVIIGKNQTDAQANTFFGIVQSVSPSFPEDGNITFTVTLSNGLAASADANADVLRSNTWEPNVSAYVVLHDSVAALKKKLLISPEDYAKLSSYTHLSGISRPMHQTSASWLRELANNYGIYLDDQGDNIVVKKLSLAEQPKLYFVYRPTNITENNSGLILSFNPECDKPPQFIGAAAGTNPATGAPIIKGSNTGSTENNGPNKTQVDDISLQPNYSATTLVPNSSPYTVPAAQAPQTTSSGVPGLGLPGIVSTP